MGIKRVRILGSDFEQLGSLEFFLELVGEEFGVEEVGDICVVLRIS